MPEAGSLAAANKRIRNILRKSDSQHVGTVLDEMMVVEDAERVLITALRLVEGNVSDCTGRGDYTGALRALAGLRGPVDAFFDKVMVNTEDARVRANRHALLKRLDGLMNQVADISKLAA
jgi:glycyl-tRNA synthetase beta chain